MASEDSIRFWKMTGAVIFLAAVLIFGYAQYRKARPSQDTMRQQLESRENAPERPQWQGRQGGGEGRRPGPPSEEERRQMRSQFMADLNLTPEQQKQMEELDKKFEGRSGREGWQERREAMNEILTEEQREQMESRFEARRGEFRQRMLERAEVLPPDQQKKFEEKLDERMEQRRQRRLERQNNAGENSNTPRDSNR